MFSSGIHAPLGIELVEYELVQDYFSSAANSHQPMRGSLVQFGRGETFTSNTGPNEAHSPDNYIYLESSNADKAKIFSPKIPKHTEICLKFYYHMHGIGWLLQRSFEVRGRPGIITLCNHKIDIGSLDVYMNSKLVWRDTSKDFTSWKLAEMSLYTTKGILRTRACW